MWNVLHLSSSALANSAHATFQALYVRIGNLVEIGANTCVDRGRSAIMFKHPIYVHCVWRFIRNSYLLPLYLLEYVKLFFLFRPFYFVTFPFKEMSPSRSLIFVYTFLLSFNNIHTIQSSLLLFNLCANSPFCNFKVTDGVWFSVWNCVSIVMQLERHNSWGLHQDR